METYKIGQHTVCRYQYSVFAAAQLLAESTKGICDRMCAREALFLYHFLRERLDHWRVSAEWCRPCDDAARAFTSAALALYEERHRRSDEWFLRDHMQEMEPPECWKEVYPT